MTRDSLSDPEAWKDNYLVQLRASRKTGLPLKQIIDAELSQRDELTERLSLRREK